MCGDFKEAIELAVGAPRKVSATGVEWDSHFIAAKLYARSAVRTATTDDAFDDDDPIQNDWMDRPRWP